MKLLLELSMECESLARAEVMSAARALNGRPNVLLEDPGVMVIDTVADPAALASRLGLCHFVSEWLDSCSPDELDSCAQKVDVPGPIRVRSTKVGESSRDLASVSRRVGAAIGRGRGVNLASPESDIRIVFSGKAHLGLVLSSIDRSSFERRKNRFMPYVYPASLHPKFARALVNLTEVSHGSRLLDPFCGTGAIIAEACLVGMEAVGTDISEKMIEGSKRNLDHLNLKAALKICDVGDIPSVVRHSGGIATDPPYGRSTSTDGEGLPGLYERAFAAFSEVLERRGRVAIVVPEMGLLDRSDDFRLLEKHELWVHRSLTRRFCVLEKR